MRHIYDRGPRFADYYLRKGGRYRYIYLMGLFTALCLLIMAVNIEGLALPVALGFMVINAVI